MKRLPRYEAIIVGGGFFGCSLALHLRREVGLETAILECGDELMQRASYANQARVHNGYHYPRSILTGLRSHLNFERFVSEFRETICDRFEAYYAVARHFSKVNAAQFRLFCKRIGAPVAPAPKDVRALFAPDLVEDVFQVVEVAFDSDKLRAQTWRALKAAEVDVFLGTEARSVRSSRTGGGLAVACATANGGRTFHGRRVFSCTYSRTNRLLVDSGCQPIPLKHEVAELALVEVPEPLRNRAVTVMCGPFFSLMPYPPRGLHSLSHVRYTPHCEWLDGPATPYCDPYAMLDGAPLRPAARHMIKDAARYIPCLAESRYVESIWETKTVLPASERDDSRPILFARDSGLRGLTCILGGKVDNIYDMIESEIADAGQP